MSFSLSFKYFLFTIGALAALASFAGCSGNGSDGGDSEATGEPLIEEGDEEANESEADEEATDDTVGAVTDKTTVLACGSISGGIENGGLNHEAKEYLLCLHNQTRSVTALGDFAGLYGDFAVATDMKRLFWDEKLEQVAQDWVNQCQWMHNPDRSTQYNTLSPSDLYGDPINGGATVGENLAYKGASNVSSVHYQFAVDGYLAWEDEGHYYSMGDFKVNDFCDTTACGHFTQLIWAETYKVGCAVNLCPAGSLAQFPTTFLACNYTSTGNYVSQRPYKTAVVVEDVCSDADQGQSTCKNGLTQANNYSNGL